MGEAAAENTVRSQTFPRQHTCEKKFRMSQAHLWQDT